LKTQLPLFVALALVSVSAWAQIDPSFTETFGGGAYDHSAWTPLNAGSSLTLLSSSTDREAMDGTNDGSLLVERDASESGTYGAVRSLGTIAAADVGTLVSVDFAYEKIADPFSNLKALLLIDGEVVAEGAPINLFAAGNDPAAADGRYASVVVRPGCLISPNDVGLELTLVIQYFDGNISQNRDLVLDAVNFINSSDPVEVPLVATTLNETGVGKPLEVVYARRIDEQLPALQYLVQDSADLSPWSWSEVEAAETLGVPVDSSYEQVTHRFAIDPDSRRFYRLVVQPKRLGDPGVSFATDKMDPAYPQMLEWQTAGVQGGIPFRDAWPVLAVVEPTDTAGIMAVLASVESEATSLGGGTVLLKNGTYTIDNTILMPSNVQLLGESRNGVELRITMLTEVNPAEPFAIRFGESFSQTVENSGLVNLTIRGAYGTPNPSNRTNAKPEFKVTSVQFLYADNCWVDDVSIINSGDHPITAWRSSHVTIRGCYLSGSWNKGEGGSGYFQVQSDHFLIVENHIRQLRHFALQKQYCEYNVVYRNFIEQDVNFHDDDNGNNLIEGNRIVLPTTITDNRWHAVMGAWGPEQHSLSRNDNFVFNNKCIEYNNGGLKSYSNSSVVYLGPRNFENVGNVFTTSNALPFAGTFYPVDLTPDPLSP
jgi:hypothetical protein